MMYYKHHYTTVINHFKQIKCNNYSLHILNLNTKYLLLSNRSNFYDIDFDEEMRQGLSFWSMRGRTTKLKDNGGGIGDLG